MKSWKTTIFGICGALGTYLATVSDPEWVRILGEILLAIGVGGTGLAARDNNKSSEDVGAKK